MAMAAADGDSAPEGQRPEGHQPDGHTEIGAEHQRMAELIQTLGVRIRERQGRDAVLSVARELAALSDLHFGHEKDLMTATGYPNANAHLWEHRGLLDKLAMLIHSLESSGADVSIYVIDFIDRWFVDHLQGADAEFGAFLANRAGWRA